MTIAFNHKAIGWRCAVLRQRAGLNEREAAIMAGIRPRTWRNLERGHPCRTETFLKVCRAFRCSADWLALGKVARI